MVHVCVWCIYVYNVCVWGVCVCIWGGVWCVCVCVPAVGYTTDDLRFMWETGDPVQMDEIALPQFDIKQEDIEYGNCTKFYAGTGMFLNVFQLCMRRQGAI